MLPYLPTHIDQEHRRMSIALRAPAALLLVLALLIILPPAGLDASVEIQSFRAQGRATDILVSWKTATEVNNQGFRLLRSTSIGGAYEEKQVFVSQCSSDCILGRSYSFADSAVAPGQIYFYKLRAIDTGRQYGPISAVVGAQSAVPTNTRAPTATVTKTATKTTVMTATYVATPIQSSTRAPIPASITPTFASTAAATLILGRTSTPAATPATKIARVVATVVGNRTDPRDGLRAEKTPQPLLSGRTQQENAPQETPDWAIPSDPPEEEDVSGEAAPSSGTQAPDRRLIGLASLALAVFLGIGSLVFAGIGAYLLARVILRS